MKLIKRILSYPLLIALLFCGILISGEQMGGFYLSYILLGLPHLIFHAVIGLVGLALLFLSQFKSGNMSVVKIVASLCLIASVLYFFLQDGGSYNYDTFHQPLPLATLIVFGAVLLYFTFVNVGALLRKKH